MKKLVKSVVFVCLLINGIAFAATVFTVQKIQVTGLQRVSNDTLMSYLPLKVGQRLEVPRQSTTIISDLYKTGFISNIKLDSS
jgi:outer membrane protein insertion porin family